MNTTPPVLDDAPPVARPDRAPITLHWTKALPTRSLEAAWAVFSDTDRFNRAANLGFTFSEAVDARGRRQKVGHVRRLGMTLSWVDDPFTFVAPTRFVSVRRFLNGPLERLETTMHLTSTSDGVQLDYTIELFPRGALARPLVWIDAVTSIRPNIDKTLAAAASQLGEVPRTYAPPPPLPPEGLDRLTQVRDLAIGPDLERLVRTADLKDQDRIRPLALAKALDRDGEAVTRELLEAVSRGVLELRFDLLCPRCHAPSQRSSTLTLVPSELHCESCGIAYDGSFPDAVEISFRPSEAVRRFEVPLDCANSPTHGPAKVARAPLPAGRQVTFGIELGTGGYRLGVEPRLGAASIEVRPGLRAREIAVDVTPGGIVPAILRVGPGPVEISVRSRLEEPASLVVERRFLPVDALTAGRLLELDDIDGVLPEGAIPADLGLSHRRAGVLVIDGRDATSALERAIRRLTHPGSRSRVDDVPLAHHTADGCWIGAYPSFDSALASARTLVPSMRLSLLVDVGRVTLVRQGETTVPQGGVVDRAITAARGLGVGRLAVPTETLKHDAEALAAVQRSGLPPRTTEDAALTWLATPSAPANMDVATPSSVGGRYALGEELARGGMGIVYAATDAQTGEDVVVKLLKPELASEPSYAQRFFWEARLTAALTHPHTVRVFDYGAEGPYVWIVMERLDGQDLHRRLRDAEPVSEELAASIAAQALEGLAAAHAQDVVHRDVKPANLFLSGPDARPLTKVLDFGIAISVYDDLELEGGSVPGTPKYLSPEQVELTAVDGRADVYAVGIVLFEMLTGGLPFEAHGSRAMALIRLAQDPRPIQSMKPSLDPDLAEIVMKALARERDARWADAREMAEALREWLGGREDWDEPDTWPGD